MQIIFFTQEDPFYVKVFFDEFFRHYKSLDEIKGIVISKPMGKKSIYKLARQMYDFYGLYDFIRMGCRYTYVKLIDKKPVARIRSGVLPRTYTIKQLAKAYGVNVIERSDLNSEDFLETIKQYDPDLFISVASPIIFKGELIKLPKIDCINIHNAPLPKYRGMLPNFWQMYHDEKTIGITIHEINPKIDEGRIILQKEVEIAPTDTLDSLIKRTKRIGAHFMIEVINTIKSGNVEYMENPATEGSYFSFPTRKDVKEFKRRGKRIM